MLVWSRTVLRAEAVIGPRVGQRALLICVMQRVMVQSKADLKAHHSGQGIDTCGLMVKIDGAASDVWKAQVLLTFLIFQPCAKYYHPHWRL